MEDGNQNTKNDNTSKKKKYNLVIDYSKFQNNFLNNKIKEENIKKIIDEEKENKTDQVKNTKNYDQFLNVSDILNENMSQSSLNENENSKNKMDSNNNQIKNNNIKNKKINRNIFNSNNYDNFSIEESEETNLLLSYNDLVLNSNNNGRRIKIEKINEKNSNNDYNKTTLNSNKKKRNYLKFINKNNLELKLSKALEKNKQKQNEKTSYAKINEKNKLFKEKQYKNNNYSNKFDKFNLFNETNNNYNNSVLTLSDISNIPSTTTTVDFITGNNSNNVSNQTYYNNKIKIKSAKSIPLLQNNYLILNKNNKNNSKSNNKTYHSVNELKLIDINKNNINSKRRKRSYEKENNLMIFVNKKKPNETYNKNKNDKNDDLIYLLDNIKTKYQKQENKYINQQKNMKSEIEILREKLKALSVNEALYQVEIEKLKRKNINNNNELNNNDIINTNTNNNLSLTKSVNTSEKRFFEKKLDDIIQKNNKDTINSNLYSFSKKTTNNKLEQLLELFNLDKDLFSDENIIFENEESFNYEKAFLEYPLLKKFIEILVEKYKKEKEYRTRLEEKTVEIFTNDMKTINILEKKIKKYEENNKQYKNNSCLNISVEGLSDNIIKNSCNSYKSCDKI